MFELIKVEDKEEWNKYLSQCINVSVFSTWEWGEFKSNSFEVIRLAVLKKERFLGLAQITLKSKFGLSFGWAPGGINFINQSDLPSIISSLESYFDFRRTVVRFSFSDEYSSNSSYLFSQVNDLKPALVKVNSGFSIKHAINIETPVLSSFSKNNRYYYRKSLKEELSFEIKSAELEEFSVVHDEMVAIKGRSDLQLSQSEFQLLLDTHSDNVKMALVRNSRGEILCASILIVFSNVAIYYLAGSTQEGRERHASFFMVHELLTNLNEFGISDFDFGGITPYKADAAGVNRFKLGFGGRLIEYIGERDYTKSWFLRALFNAYIGYILR
ncbi:lipid II:glycine glycyltransferase FemX [Thaumasiovibrio subtropicus]|uniref:lipid II:glycine glycyltransferase FemX n=1 Tax=Thaumasiovibrio subtropicus TaxID=1891207 RepID=UPI000B351296|nr:peptidoglycan bridge formation glycyltransferase FemA/FemB family protein [Thaumasiovibrio subtropicus]